VSSDFARSVAPGTVASSTEAAIARATAQFERMDPAAAVGTLEPALRADPGSVDGWKLMARLRLALDENQAALEAANKAIALAPDSAGALATASRALSLLGRHDDAVTIAYRAVIVEPKNPLWHDRVAWALLAAERQFADAEQAARTAIGLDPEEPHYYFTHGAALEALGHTDQARQALLTSLRMEPENPMAQHRLAILNGEATREPTPKKRGFKLFRRRN
jgi:tetratricopeptide (TPR) repeat protein